MQGPKMKFPDKPKIPRWEIVKIKRPKATKRKSFSIWGRPDQTRTDPGAVNKARVREAPRISVQKNIQHTLVKDEFDKSVTHIYTHTQTYISIIIDIDRYIHNNLVTLGQQLSKGK